MRTILLKLTVTTGLFGSFLASCSTTPRPPKSKLVQRQVAKTSPGKTPIVPKAGAKVMTTGADRAEQTQLGLYEKLYNEGYRLSAGELDTVQFLAKQPQKNPLEKAILVLAALEHRLIDEGASSRQLETRLDAVGVAFNQEIMANPYLQSITVTDRIIKYFQGSQDSAEFKQQFLANLQNRANSWTQLWKVSSAESDMSAIGQSIDDREQQTSETATPKTPDYNAADLQMGDSILSKARQLAQKGDYKAAISQAERVSPDSPFHPEAQDQIKSFSNKAVQGLRQKAAEAFQSSLPVVDSQTKAAYLSEAKQYLEEALQNYPDADHIQTVQDNLAVITRDLASISERQKNR